MRTFLLTTIMFFLAALMCSVNAQRTTELTALPSESFGYLAWKCDTNIVKHHRYEITRLSLENDSTTTVVERGEIWGSNYLLIPYEYFNPSDGARASYVLTLTGVDANNDEIPFDTQDLEVGGGGVPQCYFECHSSDYAYRIQQTKKPQNKNTYSLQPAYAYHDEELGISIPHYMYFSPDQFDDHLANSYPAFHSMLQGWPEEYVAGNTGAYSHTTSIMVYENTYESEFFDNTGAIILDPTVYAIKKGFGPWGLEQPIVVDTNEDHCNEPGPEATLNTMINYMNLHNPGLYVELTCAALLGGFTGDGNDDDDDDDSDDDIVPCNVVFEYGVTVTPDGDAIYTSFIEQYIECENTGESGGGSPGHGGGITDNETNVVFTELLTSCEAYQLVKLGREGERTVVSGSASDFTTIDGSPSIPVHVFETGLYRVSVKKPGEYQKDLVFEMEQPFKLNVEHKDYFNALIYPNPHINDYYFFDIQTTARLKAVYELFDSNGNKLFEQNFDLPKDHDDTHKVVPAAILNSGFLYHKFTFEDGSHASYTTIMN